MRTFLAVAVALVLMPSTAVAQATFSQLLRADLSARIGHPPSNSPAKAFASLALNDFQTVVDMIMRFEGLVASATAVHVHFENGSVVFTVSCPPATAGTCALVNRAVTPTQVSQLRTGKWYVDIHSSAFPSGEIEGKLWLDVPLPATLNGAQVVPSTGSSATGAAEFSIGGGNTMLAAWISVEGLASPDRGLHIHAPAAPGSNGPVVVDMLFTNASTFVLSGMVAITPAQAVLVKTNVGYFDVHTDTFPDGEIRGALERTVAPVADFDGDGRSEIAVFRPPPGPDWHMLNPATHTLFSIAWLYGMTLLTPGDCDGDGKTDPGAWDSSGQFRCHMSRSSVPPVINTRQASWGIPGDDARVTADYDGDNSVDFAVFRPGSGPGQQSLFFIIQTADGVVRAEPFGLNIDVGVFGDYDGDRKNDVAVYRTTTGTYYVLDSMLGFRAQQWGDFSTDVVVPGDYDGDGRTDFAVWRGRTDGTSGTWFILESSTATLRAQQWGIGAASSIDRPVPADYDGDGKTDLAVVRASGGVLTWYVLRSSDGMLQAEVFGFATDIPVATYLIR